MVTSADKKTLWVVSELYYPEMTSTGYYLTSIAEGLARDRTVRVLTGQPTYAARGQRAPKKEIRHGVEISRAWGTTFDKNVLPFRLINMFTIAVSIFFKARSLFRQGDDVLVVTAPQSLPVAIALASLMRGARYTLLVHDSYPEIMIAVGATKPGSPVVKAVNFINRWVYKHASKIIVMGRDMNELFLKKTEGLDIPIKTIPNWAELESIKPTDRYSNALLREYGLSDKFIFMFAGNIGRPIDFDTIMLAAEKLSGRPEFHFIFVGSGVKLKSLHKQVKERSLFNVLLLGARPRGEQEVFLNACDVGLVSLVEGMWGTAMPSKTYNIMAAGRPILALTEPGSELARVIDEEGIGWHVPPGNVDDLVNTIEKIYELRNELPERGRLARKAAVAKYSLDTALEAYRSALE